MTEARTLRPKPQRVKVQRERSFFSNPQRSFGRHGVLGSRIAVVHRDVRAHEDRMTAKGECRLKHRRAERRVPASELPFLSVSELAESAMSGLNDTRPMPVIRCRACLQLLLKIRPQLVSDCDLRPNPLSEPVRDCRVKR